jgi:hypothetical protein
VTKKAEDETYSPSFFSKIKNYKLTLLGHSCVYNFIFSLTIFIPSGGVFCIKITCLFCISKTYVCVTTVILINTVFCTMLQYI